MVIQEKRSNGPPGSGTKNLQGHVSKNSEKFSDFCKKSSNLAILTQFEDGKALDASFQASESAQKSFPLTW